MMFGKRFTGAIKGERFRRFVACLLLLSAIQAVYLLIRPRIPYRFGFQGSKSVSCDLFLFKTRDFRVEKGDLVLFRVKDYGPLADIVDGLILLKHVGALPGDFLVCHRGVCGTEDGIISPPIPPSLEPNAIEIAGTIPMGFFAPVGEYERSYDVRFAGLAPLDGIEGKVVLCIHRYHPEGEKKKGG